jgi:hypothetical protein
VKFRKKPVVIDAMQWDGQSINDALAFMLDGHETFDHLPRAPDNPHVQNGVGYTPADGRLSIPTLEGTVTASPGDWIIRGVAGEFYPCKPDIFAATYEYVGPWTCENYDYDENVVLTFCKGKAKHGECTRRMHK